MLPKPPILYKYRRIGPHTKSLLVSHELYFSTPYEINDPFDCRIILNRDAPAEVLWEKVKAHYGRKYGVTDEVELVQRMLSEYAPQGVAVTRNRAAKVIENREWAILTKSVEAGNTRMLESRMKKTRLCCFSASADSILMWSHYADSHRGICLGFTPEGVIGIVDAVDYVDDYPDLSAYLVDDDTYYRYTFYTKAADWKYESEWRFVLTAADRVETPVYHYPSQTLKEIIFGCQCTNADRLTVQSWLRSGGLEPKLFDAVPSRNAFRLQIKELAEGD